jgi:hypothetical protein
MPPKRGNGKRRKAVHPSPNEAEVSSQRSLRTRTVTIKEKKAVKVRLRSSMMVDKEEERPAHELMLKQVCRFYLVSRACFQLVFRTPRLALARVQYPCPMKLKSLLAWWWIKRRRKWFTIRCGSRFVDATCLPSVPLTFFQDAGPGASSTAPDEAEVSSGMVVEQEEKKVVHEAMWKQVYGLNMSPERASDFLSGCWPWHEFNCAQ